MGSITSSLYAQLDSLQVLPEVIVSDVKLRDFSQGLRVETLQDSVIRLQKTALTDVLRNNSLIYFKENGIGGVSSPSFRGTTAQQTAVVWNGININSQLLGQTDFNTISSRNYDNVTVRSGGGSIPYGSGAIGGSVHLNNDISFSDKFENDVTLGYGSFETPFGNLKSRYSTDKFYGDVAVDYFASENDFEYLETDRINENGAFETVNLNANFGFVLPDWGDKKQLIKVYHNSYLGDREFSGTLTAVSTAGYQDRNTRTLGEWDVLGKTFDSKLRLAHVFEQYRFYTDSDNRDNYTSGKAIRYTANYDFTYRFGKDKSLKTIIDYTSVDGEGSNIVESTRNTFAVVGLWQHQVTKKLDYGLQLRQEATADFDNPILFGMNVGYAFAKAYKLSVNASRNYRVPTFNDLFWNGAGAMGNPDLIPESSYQAEIGHEFRLKNFQGRIATYYIQSDNQINWQPNGSGIWMPINVNEVQNYGAEVSASYAYTFGEHTARISGQYGYTKATDVEKDTQLIYVPVHKMVGGAEYDWRFISMGYQFLYNDEVFITTDNKGTLSGYAVSNFNLDFKLLDKEAHNVVLSLQAKNIFNKNYQTVAFRPNPGRNFLIQTTYSF